MFRGGEGGGKVRHCQETLNLVDTRPNVRLGIKPADLLFLDLKYGNGD